MIKKSTWWLLLASLLSITCSENITTTGPGNPFEGTPHRVTSVKLRVVSTYPAPNSFGSSAEGAIDVTVTFNKQMDSASVVHAIRLTTPGGALLPSSRVSLTSGGYVAVVSPVTVSPSQYCIWRVGQKYTLVIDSSAQDVNGERLSPGFTMSFTPEPTFRVVSFSPPANTKDYQLTSGLTVQFNSPVGLDMINAIQMSPPIHGSWAFLNSVGGIPDSSNPVYSCEPDFFTSTQFTISAPEGMQDVFGNPLVGGFTSSLTSAAFKVTSASPQVYNLPWSPTNLGISINFNAGFHYTSVQGPITFSPPIAGEFTYYSETGEIYFQPSANPLPDTVYIMTIDSSMHSVNGSPLSPPTSFKIKTGNF